MKKRYKIWLNYVIGPALFIFLAVSIYYKIRGQANLQQTKDLLKAAVSGTNAWFIVLLVLFMLVNWGLEARKWQILVSCIENVSFFKAYKAVLSGLALSLFLPNGLGDYAGKVMFMKEGNRLRSISSNVVGSMAQLITTLSAGLIGLLYLKDYVWLNAKTFEGLSFFWVNGIIFLIGLGALLILFVYFKLGWLTIMFEKLPIVRKYRFMVEHLEHISRGVLTRILLLSIIRFNVFLVQYMVTLHIFNVQINLVEGLSTICVLFLVLAILPTIPVADLGVRGEAALQLFGIISINKLGIIATTTGIWLVNLILPAMAGSLFILGIKLFRNR